MEILINMGKLVKIIETLILYNLIIISFSYCANLQSNSNSSSIEIESKFYNESLSTAAIDYYNNNTRQSRGIFPFYTIGRFVNAPCTASNSLLGTCVLMGECLDANGIPSGSCSTLTRQATCCVYQGVCGTVTSNNNTYFVNPGYPSTWSGGSSCSITVNPCSASVCQLQIQLLDFSIAPPTGDGDCITDGLTVAGGASAVPRICGENSGQHVYVDFSGTDAIVITIAANGGFTFFRHWNIIIVQVSCTSQFKAPEGCLQYYTNPSGTISSFNYSPSPSGALNSIGVDGTRQLANMNYGICISAAAGQCSITYSQVGSDPASFTITGVTNSIAPDLLGTGNVQSQMCTTDFVIIPNPSQTGVTLINDRFCGLGLNPTTSNISPFVLYVVTDGNEDNDILNRGFSLSYSQNNCPL